MGQLDMAEEPETNRSCPTTHVLVGGMPRSGTTAFVEFLCDNFEMEALPETHFLNIVDASGQFHLGSLPESTSHRSEIESLLKTCRDNGRSGFIDFIDQLAAHLNIKSDILIEKTPSHVMSMDRLDNEPGLARIIVLRRCELVCGSLRKVSWNQGTPLRNALRWARFAMHSRKYVREGKAALVLHESLLDDRDGLTKRIGDAFGFPARQTPRRQASFDVAAEPWKKTAGQKGYVRPQQAPALPLPAKALAWLLDRTLYPVLARDADQSLTRHQDTRADV